MLKMFVATLCTQGGSRRGMTAVDRPSVHLAASKTKPCMRTLPSWTNQ